jgi:hypothetical protein
MGFNGTATSMVLRILFISFLLLQTPDSFAISRKKRNAFKQAKKRFKASDYSKTIEILKKHFNFKSYKTPIGALQLAGYSYSKSKEYRACDTVFTTLIKRKYRKTNARILRRYKESRKSDAVGKVPTTLAMYYYYKAHSIAQIFLSNYDQLDEAMQVKYKKNALMYAKFSLEGEFEEEDPEQIIADINNFNLKKDSIKYKYGSFIGINYVTWRDKLTLVDSNGQESILISNSEGLCLGGGLRKYNAEFEYNINGCIGINNATVGANTDATVNYFQKNVPVIGAMAAVGLIWKPKTEGTGLGFHIPVMYRKGDYTNPADISSQFAGTTLKASSSISVGGLVEGKWNFVKWELSVKFGKFTGLDSSYWSIGMLYGF